MLHLWSQLQVIKQQRALESNRSAEVWRSVREEETEAIAKVNHWVVRYRFFLSFADNFIV